MGFGEEKVELSTTNVARSQGRAALKYRGVPP